MPNMWLMLWNQKGFDEICTFGAMEGYFLHYVLAAEVISSSQRRRIFRRRMPCSYVEKQYRRNSLQLQSYDSFCCNIWLQRWHKGNQLWLCFSSGTDDTCKLIELIHVSLFSFLCYVTQLSKQDETVLKIITYVGLSLSIIGILVTSALYFFFT